MSTVGIARTPAGYVEYVFDADVAPRGAVVSCTIRTGVRARRGHPLVDQAFDDYVHGNFASLNRIVVQQDGGGFAMKAWEQLRDVPAGETVTYTELAQMAGSPRAARAAGTACATNAVMLLVPCHRVVAARGLGGYAFGRDTKLALLAHEGIQFGAA